MTKSEQAPSDALADAEINDFSEEHYSSRFNTLRLCSVCKTDALQSRLIHHSTRRYAHATCLLGRKGWKTIIALPAYQRDRAVRVIARAAFRAMPGLRESR